jgi:hypothetical protein
MILTTNQKQQLTIKAMKEEAFQTALLQDAKAAASAALQLTLPATYRLHVVQANPQHIVLVLPPYPAECSPQASVDDLLQRLRQELLSAGEAVQQRIIDGQTTLIAKAWHDAAYKQALLRDPKAVVAREFGAPLPAEVSMQVVAEDAHTQYLVLPPALSDLELSDEQLEQVAGGEVGLITTVVLSVLGVGVVGGIITATVMEGRKW